MDDDQILRVGRMRADGASDADIRHSTAGLERLAPGAYAATSGLEPARLHLLRAQAMTSRLQGVVASHVTAGLAWGLPVPTSCLGTVHLSPTVERLGSPKSGSGYRMHYRPVDARDRGNAQRLAVTAPLRTVLECPRVLPTDWAVAVADAAVHANLVGLVEVVEAAAAVRAVRGAARIRAVSALVSPHAESPGESLLRLRLRRMGKSFAEQVAMPWVEGNPRVDFIVEGQVVIEFDGRMKYGLSGDVEAAHWAEKQRHDRLVEAGYEVVRVTWDQLWDEPALLRRIEAALSRARRRGGR